MQAEVVEDDTGGRKDAAELVRDFLGRDYTFDAYAEWLAR